MITIVCWKWQQIGCRSSYNANHVNVWARMVKRNFQGEARLLCITDGPKSIEIETFPLWNDFSGLPNPYGGHLPSCYRRLKIFSQAQTDGMGIPRGSQVLSLDLDIVILKDITKLFGNVQGDFAGWKRIGPTKPPGYNGSIFMFRVGTTDDLWDNFDPQLSPVMTRRAGQYGSDQGWISLNRDAANGLGWTQASGVYSYTSDIQKSTIPSDARIVSFNGRHKPWTQLKHPRHHWIKANWQ